MQSIEDKIISKIKKCGRGSAFFAADFALYGQGKSVNKALERLVRSGVLVRIARGIYFYPKTDKKLGLGVLLPPLEAIAEAIAKRDKAKIAPTGIYALNRLGLSTQVPMNIVYLTTGSPRTIKVGEGRGIKFMATAPKNLAFQSELALLVTLALKEISKEKVTPEQIEQIKKVLQKEPKERIWADLALMPVWIRTIVTNCYE